MNLHVVAYPQLSAADMERIQLCRKEHNSLYHMIGAHFTLVFSVPDMPLEVFSVEVRKQVHGYKSIPFTFRCAVINRDAISGHYDAFLVPDEGHSAIYKLHDQLYSDKLAYQHRLDISYIPHLSIASNSDPLVIKKIVNEWNAQPFAISGTITTLDIINYENRIISTVERVMLG
ncbi:MAG: 2'-5' RNA ligase family protein [Bacteroidota bacterium]